MHTYTNLIQGPVSYSTSQSLLWRSKSCTIRLGRLAIVSCSQPRSHAHITMSAGYTSQVLVSMMMLGQY